MADEPTATIGELAIASFPEYPWHALTDGVMFPRATFLRGFDGLKYLRAICAVKIAFGLPPMFSEGNVEIYSPRHRPRFQAWAWR